MKYPMLVLDVWHVACHLSLSDDDGHAAVESFRREIPSKPTQVSQAATPRRVCSNPAPSL
jgi:hypothetical protein